MKLLFGALLLCSTTAVLAQEPVAPMVERASRVSIKPTTSANVFVSGVTKQAPFTADESGETVRITADGNRITESWTGKIARNSLGRIHRDITSGKLGDGSSRPMIFGGGSFMPSVVALGAAEGTHTLFAKIDAENAASGGHRIIVAPATEARLSGLAITAATDEAKRTLYTKLEKAAAVKGESMVVGTETILIAPEATLAARSAIESDLVTVAMPTRAAGSGDVKFQSRKESLGKRDFSGVEADGHRLIMTYPAGSIGNDREIEVVSETWFAKDLGVIVYSKRTDPRFGETTYQMTNINRVEPDASLFPGK